MVIQTPEGDKIECMIRLDFPTTNNEAEYEALVTGLDLARAAGAENMIMHCDSQVITRFFFSFFFFSFFLRFLPLFLHFVIFGLEIES